MPSTISAGTTAGTAIAIAGDTTGNLAFQTNGTTTAMTIDTSQRVGVGTSSPSLPLDINTGGSGSVNINGTGSGPWMRWQLNGTAFAYLGSGAQLGAGNASDFCLNSQNNMTFTSGGNSERMRIDSSGRVLTPFQTSSSYSRSGNITYNSTAELIYNLSRVDIGSAYSTSTGRFTAPVRGVYIASASAYAVNGSGLASISLRKNGVSSGNPIIQLSRNGSDYQTLTATATFFLEVGDYLSVTWEGGSIYIDSNTAFSVALLG